MPVLEAGFPPCLKVSGSTTSRNHGREATRRAEESKRTCTRAPPKRVGRAFTFLTRLIMGVGKPDKSSLVDIGPEVLVRFARLPGTDKSSCKRYVCRRM